MIEPIRIEIERTKSFSPKSDDLHRRFLAKPSGLDFHVQDAALNPQQWRNQLNRVKTWFDSFESGLIQKDGEKTITFTFTGASDIEKMSYGSFILTQIEQTFEKIQYLLECAQRHIFPISLMDSLQFQKKMNEMLSDQKSRMTRDQLMEIIHSRKLFYATHSDCPPAQLCDMHFQLFVPIVTTNEKFELNEIHTLPHARKTFMREKWQQLIAPFQQAVVSKSSIFNYENFDCFTDVLGHEVYPCELCKLQESLDHDDCAESIIRKKNYYKSCKTQDVDNSEEMLIQLDDKNYLVSDHTPGKMKETCEAETQVTEMPKTVHVNFDPNCTYVFEENTLSDMDISDGHLSLSRSSPNLINLHDQTQMTVLSEHFQEHSTAYIISMITLFFTSTAGSFAYMYCMRRNNIIEIRNRRQGSEPDVGQALVRFIRNRETV
jgi:hypothetical protein